MELIVKNRQEKPILVVAILFTAICACDRPLFLNEKRMEMHQTGAQKSGAKKPGKAIVRLNLLDLSTGLGENLITISVLNGTLPVPRNMLERIASTISVEEKNNGIFYKSADEIQKVQNTNELFDCDDMHYLYSQFVFT